MSTDNTEPASMDRIDRMLTDAFDQAVVSMPTTHGMLDLIMARIRARQRIRFLLLLGIGIAAMLIAVINGLPLVGLALEALGTVTPTEWSTQLPTILVGAVVVLGSMAFLHMLADDPI